MTDISKLNTDLAAGRIFYIYYLCVCTEEVAISIQLTHQIWYIGLVKRNFQSQSHFTFLTSNHLYTKCEESHYFHKKKYVYPCLWYLKNYLSAFHEIWTVAGWLNSNLGPIRTQGWQKFTKICVFDCCFIVEISKKIPKIILRKVITLHLRNKRIENSNFLSNFDFWYSLYLSMDRL